MQIGLTIKVFTSTGLQILTPGKRRNIVRATRRPAEKSAPATPLPRLPKL